MDKQSLIFTSLIAILALSLMLMAIQFLAKKLKIKSIQNEKTQLSYSVWFGAIIISFIIPFKIALELIENSIELLITDATIINTFMAVTEKIALFTGFSFIYTFAAYYIVNILFKYIVGNRNDSIEIANDNVGYYVNKGLVLIALVYSLSNVFEHFLRWFAPIIDTPFYH
jgi:hypothetical protein